ncbi:MAG: O-antigen ligase family protein [Verrucomicrobiota bacterium]
MPVVSSIFLVFTLVLAVVIGPQTRSWSWGPALIALGIASCAALPALWRKNHGTGSFALAVFGTIVALWFALRAWASPVAEYGQADLMLLAAVVGTFVCLRAIEGSRAAESVLGWGIALLLLASSLVIWKQVIDPSFSPVFGSRVSKFPAGFYAHYNEGANFLIATSFLVAAGALFGNQRAWVRMIWLLIALGGLVAIFFTRSRGGILGATVGLAIFSVVALMIGQRTKAKWVGPAVIAVPLVGIALAAFLYLGWKDSQALRLANTTVVGDGIGQLMDENSRLFMLGLAVSCIGLHPFAGGGSRSYGWEAFRFSDGKAQGDIITHIPQLVHNELMQAATDYGIVGAVLLLGLIGALAITAIIRILFADPSRSAPHLHQVWRIGGMAALAGMFIQSCFSSVFHLLPGSLLLGISLGMLAYSPGVPAKRPIEFGMKALLVCAAVLCAAFLLPIGWKGTQVTRTQWSTYFSKQPITSVESRLDSLTDSLGIWPLPSLYKERAFEFQRAMTQDGNPDEAKLARAAIADHEAAAALNPFDPTPAVNRANLLSQLEEDAQAEEAYQLAISLQGGMEPAFRARFFLAQHLLRKGLRFFKTDDPVTSEGILLAAAHQMEQSIREMHWPLRDMEGTRVAIFESLGAAHEATGNYDDAMRQYDLAIQVPTGITANYRAGKLHSKLASIAWNARKPSEALWHFNEANRRIRMADILPAGVKPSDRAEHLAYLDKAIAFLKGAHVQPEPPAE